MGSDCLIGMGFLLDDENALKLDKSGGGGLHCEYTRCHWLYTLKCLILCYVNFNSIILKAKLVLEACKQISELLVKLSFRKCCIWTEWKERRLENATLSAFSIAQRILNDNKWASTTLNKFSEF